MLLGGRRTASGIALLRFVLLALVALAVAVSGLDPYRVLGLSRSATSGQITKAYRKQARIWHPDKHTSDPEKAHAKFAEIASSYEILSDPARKKEYDQHGTYATSAAGGARAGGQQHQQQHNPYGGGGYGYYYQQQYELQQRYTNYLNSLTAANSRDQLIIKLHAENYEQTIKRRTEPGALRVWLIYVYSDPCAACTRMTPVVQSIAESLFGVVRVGSVHSDFESSLIQKLGVRYTPSLLVVSARDGQMHTVSISSLTGGQPFTQLTAAAVVSAVALYFDDHAGLGAPDVPASAVASSNAAANNNAIPAQALMFITAPPSGHPLSASYSYSAGGVNKHHRSFIAEKLNIFRNTFGWGVGRVSFIVISKRRRRPHVLLHYFAERMGRTTAFAYISVPSLTADQWSDLIRDYRIPPAALTAAGNSGRPELRSSLLIAEREPNAPLTYLRFDDSGGGDDDDTDSDGGDDSDDDSGDAIGLTRQRDRLQRIFNRHQSMFVSHITAENYFDRCFRREAKWRKPNTAAPAAAGATAPAVADTSVFARNGHPVCLIFFASNASSLEANNLLLPLIRSQSIGYAFSDGRRIDERSSPAAAAQQPGGGGGASSREDGEWRELDADDASDPDEWRRRGFIQAGWVQSAYQSEWMKLTARAFTLSAKTASASKGSVPGAAAAAAAVTASTPQFVLLQPITQKLLVYAGARIGTGAEDRARLEEWIRFALDPATPWVDAVALGGIPFVASEPDETLPIVGSTAAAGAWQRMAARFDGLSSILSPIVNAFKPSGLSIDTGSANGNSPLWMFLPLIVTLFFILISTRSLQL